jgi:hypothetical protein
VLIVLGTQNYQWNSFPLLRQKVEGNESPKVVDSAVTAEGFVFKQTYLMMLFGWVTLPPTRANICNLSC